jgi:hypothetical protein
MSGDASEKAALVAILGNMRACLSQLGEHVDELAGHCRVLSDLIASDPMLANEPELRGSSPQPMPPLSPLGPFPPRPSTVPEPKAVVHPVPNVLSHPVFRRPKKPQGTP